MHVSPGTNDEVSSKREARTTTPCRSPRPSPAGQWGKPRPGDLLSARGGEERHRARAGEPLLDDWEGTGLQIILQADPIALADGECVVDRDWLVGLRVDGRAYEAKGDRDQDTGAVYDVGGQSAAAADDLDRFSAAGKGNEFGVRAVDRGGRSPA